MGSVTVKTCDATAVSQVWNVMADGRVALQASSPRKRLEITFVNGAELTPELEECLDLQYMTDRPGTTVGLYSCAGLGNTGAGDKGINWPQINAAA
jgi:hypothetical protein